MHYHLRPSPEVIHKRKHKSLQGLSKQGKEGFAEPESRHTRPLHSAPFNKAPHHSLPSRIRQGIIVSFQHSSRLGRSVVNVQSKEFIQRVGPKSSPPRPCARAREVQSASLHGKSLGSQSTGLLRAASQQDCCVGPPKHSTAALMLCMSSLLLLAKAEEFNKVRGGSARSPSAPPRAQGSLGACSGSHPPQLRQL